MNMKITIKRTNSNVTKRKNTVSYFPSPKNSFSESDFHIKAPFSVILVRNIFFFPKKFEFKETKSNHEFQNDSHNFLRPFCPDNLRCTTWWKGKHARTFDPVQRTITTTNVFVTKKASFGPTTKIWTIRLKLLYRKSIDYSN